MIEVEGKTIRITKGDTLEVEIKLKSRGKGEPVTLNEGDSVRFALKRKYTDPEPLLLKDIPISTMCLRLESEETKLLEPQRVPYVYDVQVTFADGTVDTVIGKDRKSDARFYVLEEVE